MENIITTAFDGMSQAIADLVVDGEADFGSLIRSINKMIVQLVVSQAFQQLFGGTGVAGGQAGGNIFGSLFSGFKSLFGLQTGGSFTVGSQTGIAPLPNGGNDNRLVAFRAQDGEQVTVTPRGQAAGGGSTNQTIVNFNITTPDVQGFRASESQLAAKAARMIGRGQRNM
jgi:phage-related minor tail protein